MAALSVGWVAGSHWMRFGIVHGGGMGSRVFVCEDWVLAWIIVRALI